MKVIIDIDENCIEDQVIVKCRKLDENIVELQKMINNAANQKMKLELSKDNKDYYIDAEEIIFFETEGDAVRAHTRDDIFITKYRLYELEKILPWYFSRVSKSSILNVREIYSITKNLAASSVVEFRNTHKQVYVSRAYYKPLKSKIDEMRNLE